MVAVAMLRHRAAEIRTARLLFDLKALAEGDATLETFTARINALRERKARFLERLVGLDGRVTDRPADIREDER